MCKAMIVLLKDGFGQHQTTRQVCLNALDPHTAGHNSIQKNNSTHSPNMLLSLSPSLSLFTSTSLLPSPFLELAHTP